MVRPPLLFRPFMSLVSDCQFDHQTKCDADKIRGNIAPGERSLRGTENKAAKKCCSNGIEPGWMKQLTELNAACEAHCQQGNCPARSRGEKKAEANKYNQA